MFRFADIVLPLPIPSLFTYRIPENLKNRISIGMRVVVPFGMRKKYTGLVIDMHDNVPSFELKDILSVEDSAPILEQKHIDFWKWVANYYMAPLGDVFKAALPSKMRVDSEKYARRTTSDFSENELTDTEKSIFEKIPFQWRKISNISFELDNNRILDSLRNLEKKNCIVTEDRVKFSDSHSVDSIERNVKYADFEDEKLLFLFKNASRQKKIIEQFLKLEKGRRTVSINELLMLSNANRPILNEIVKKGIFNLVDAECEIPQLLEKSDFIELSVDQENALTEIEIRFQDDKTKPILLFSTLTDNYSLYAKLIHPYAVRGDQVLILLPEISDVDSLIAYFKLMYGERAVGFHSEMTDHQRADVWQRVLSDDSLNIIIGTRLSIFLPFKRLGLIIVDNEQDSSFKQSEASPRYHLRDSVIYLSHLFGSSILLSSSSPSINSFHNAKKGKYSLVELKDSIHSGSERNNILLVDTSEQRRKKMMKGLFSPVLLREIGETLKSDRQVILLRNKKGYASWVECRNCDWIPKCERCDISMVYYKSKNLLSCPYCGKSMKMPSVCPKCKGDDIVPIGAAIEHVEEELKNIFPDVKVERLDSDIASTRKKEREIMERFRKGKIKILIATQMISGERDFSNVRLIAVLNADGLINYPDFKVHESAFQLISGMNIRQLGQNPDSLFIIQTSNSKDPIFEKIISRDYEHFYRDEIEERKFFDYPPFKRLIVVYLKHKNYLSLENASAQFSRRTSDFLNSGMIGAMPYFGKKDDLFHSKRIFVKVDRGESLAKIKNHLSSLKTEIEDKIPNLQIYFDVDP